MSLRAHRRLDAGPALDVLGPDVLRADDGRARVAPLRRLDPGDGAAREHEPLDLDAFDDPDAAPPRRAREGAGDEVRVGESCFGLEADQGGVVEAADGQAPRRVRGESSCTAMPCACWARSAARSGASFGPSGAAIR